MGLTRGRRDGGSIGGTRRSWREKEAEEGGDGKGRKLNLWLSGSQASPASPAPSCRALALAGRLAYLLLAPAGSRLRPHQEAPRSYKFRLPSSQAASAATCAAAHSQGQ